MLIIEMVHLGDLIELLKGITAARSIQELENFGAAIKILKE